MPHALEAALRFLDPSWVIPVLVIAGASWFTYSKWRIAEGVNRLAREMGIQFSTDADELLGFLRREQAPQDIQLVLVEACAVEEPPHSAHQMFRVAGVEEVRILHDPLQV